MSETFKNQEEVFTKVVEVQGTKGPYINEWQPQLCCLVHPVNYHSMTNTVPVCQEHYEILWNQVNNRTGAYLVE